MAGKHEKVASALLAQSRVACDWLAALVGPDFERPSVLSGCDVRTLVVHLAEVHTGLLSGLDRPGREPPLPVWEYVRRYRSDGAALEAATRKCAAERAGPELVAHLAKTVDDVEVALTRRLPAVLEGPRGPLTLLDFVETRVVKIVVHADDLSRSLPERPPIRLERAALSSCSRTLTAILAGQQPGRSVEVRVPPFAAVQCGLAGDPGPTHTRGTPPNVVETDPVTFLRLATGRISWDDARGAHLIKASGQRANLAQALPLLS